MNDVRIGQKRLGLHGECVKPGQPNNLTLSEKGGLELHLVSRPKQEAI